MGKGTMGSIGHNHILIKGALLLVIVGTAIGVAAAAPNEADLFDKAYDLYLSFQSEKAVEAFTLFMKEFPTSSALDAAVFWKARALLRAGRVEEAQRTFRRLRDEFPQSPFREFAKEELDAIDRRESGTKTGKEEGKKKVRTAADAAAEKYEESLRKSELRIKDLQNNVSEISSENELLKRNLARVEEEKNASARLLEEEKKKSLSSEQKSAGPEVQRLSAKIEGLTAERDSAVSKLKAATKERDEAAASLKEIESRLPAMNEMATVLREREKFQGEQDEYIKKLKQELGSLTEEVRERDKKLSELARTIKSMEGKAGGKAEVSATPGDAAEKRVKEAEFQGLMKAAEQKDKEITELRSRLREAEKKSGEGEANLKKLSAENTRDEEKLAELGRLREENQRLRREGEQAKVADKQKADELRKVAAERDALQKGTVGAGGKDKEIKELTAKLQEQEKRSKETDAAAKRALEERAALDGRLKENETKLAELGRLREENQRLQREGEQVKVAERQRADELRKVAEERDALQKRTATVEAELSAVRRTTLNLKGRVLQVGGEKYSPQQVDEEGLVAGRVESKMGVYPSWRTGDAYEDFIRVRLLLRKADEKDKKRIQKDVGPLSQKYAFNGAETVYLEKYLIIDDLLKKKKSGGSVDESSLRAYYEANKKDYLKSAEERYVKYLVAKYSKTDKGDKVALVSQIMREVAGGKSLEDVSKSHPGRASLQLMKFEKLSPSVKEKVRDLKDGELTSWFAEDQFILVQMQVRGPVYKDYEEVRQELAGKLYPHAKKGASDFDSWFAGIATESTGIKNQFMKESASTTPETKDLAASLREREKHEKEQADYIEKLKDGIDSLAKKALEERKGFEGKLKENEVKLAELGRLREENQRLQREGEQAKVADKQKADALKKVAAERDALRKGTTESGSKDKEIKELAARLQEQDKRNREADAAAKKALEERKGFEGKLKENEVKLAELGRLREENQRLQREGEQAKVAEKQKTDELRKVAAARDALQKGTAESGGKDKEIKELTVKLQEQDKRNREADAAAKKALEERTALEGKLKESEVKLAELGKLREENQRLQRENLKVKEAYEASARGTKETPSQVAALQERTRIYEVPVVKIGDELFTRVHIIDESIVSSRVLSKIAAVQPVWRKGNVYEDFITEQLLFNRAVREGIPQKAKEADEQAKKYSFNPEERLYLNKYLMMSELIRKKFGESAPQEREMRDWYEAHKRDFAMREEDKHLMALVANSTKGDEAEIGLLAAEIQGEGLKGKSFDHLASEHRGKVALKKVRLGDLPEWVRARTKTLEEGQISNVIFTGDQYMILQMPKGGAAHYRKYEDVREEIRAKMISQRKDEPAKDLAVWLNELRRGAIEIR